MNSFNQQYLEILRRQVDEEINFLVRNGHDVNKIHVPCMFCFKTTGTHFNCRRLIDLRQFQSSIALEQAKIGKNEAIPLPFTNFNHEALPLMGALA